MGDLWFSLGIKDNTHKELNQVLKMLQSIGDTADKTGKNWGGFANVINELNKKIVDAEKNGGNASKTVVKALKNAMDYLKMLQEIQYKRVEISRLRSTNKDIDTSNLDKGLQLLKEYERELLNLQKSTKFGGVDNAVISAYRQGLRNTMTDVNELEKAFKKDNSLADAANNVARLKEKLVEVTSQLTQIRQLRKEAWGKYDATPLISADNKLRAIQTRLNNMISDSSMSENTTAFRKLISDVSLKTKEATAAIQQYNIGKKNAIQASQKAAEKEREYAEAVQRAKAAEQERKRITSEYSDSKEFWGQTRHQQELNALKQDILARSKQQAEAEAKTKQELREQVSVARDLASAFSRVHSAASKTSQVASDIKNLFLQGGIVYAAQSLTNSLINTGGSIVQQRVAIETILQDQMSANKLFKQTQQLALDSPFKFSELNKDVKQLSAFGVEANNLYDTAKRLADISSGLGVSFERLGLAYGQVKARSWLDGKELRQFAYAGLPLLKNIAELYNRTQKGGRSNYTEGEVKGMITKRQVSFEDVDAVIKHLTDEGGQFYNMQDVLSHTLLGRYNKLIDAWDIMLGKFAEGKNVIGNTLSSAIDLVTALVLQMDKFSSVFLAMGASHLVTRLSGIGSSMSYANRLDKAKNEYSDTLLQKAMTKDLSADEARILATREKIDYNDLHLLATHKGLTQEMLNQLRLSGRITQNEYKRLAATAGLRAEGNRLQLSLYSGIERMAKGVSGFAKNLWAMIGGWPGLIITSGTAVISWLLTKDNEIKERTRQTTEGIYDRYKHLSEVTPNNKPDNAGLQEGVDEMVKSLEQYSALAGTVKENVFATDKDGRAVYSLSQQYDELRKKLIQTRDAYNELKKTREGGIDLAESANKDTGSWFFGKGDYRSIVNDYAEAFSSLKSAQNSFLADGVGKEKAITAALADSTFSKAIQQKKIDVKNYEAVVKELISVNNDRDKNFTYQNAIANANKSLANEDDAKASFNRLKAAHREYIDEAQILDKKSTDYREKLLDRYRAKFGYNVAQWTAAQKQAYAEGAAAFVRNIEGVDKLSDQEVTNLINKLIVFEQNGNNILKPFQIALDDGAAQRKIASLLAEMQRLAKTWHIEIMVDNPGTVEDAIKQIRQKYKSALDTLGNESSAIAKAVKGGSVYKDKNGVYHARMGAGQWERNLVDEVNKANKEKTSGERWAKEKGFSLVDSNPGGKTLRPKKDKSGSNKKDTELEKWKEYESLLRDYYSTWDKWRKVEGAENARNRVKSMKNFSPISSIFSDPDKLPENLEQLRRIVKGHAGKNRERIKYYEELGGKAEKERADVEYEKEQRTIKILEDRLDLLQKEYDIYEKLSQVMDKTYAKDFAFGGRTYEPTYYKELLEEVGNRNFSRFGGLNGAVNASQEELAGEYGEYTANRLKRIREVRDKLDNDIADSLVKGYTYFQDTKAQIDAINESYDNQIERLEERNRLAKENPDYVTDDSLRRSRRVINQQRYRDIDKAKLDAFRKSSDYLNFFAAAAVMSSKKANILGNTIRKMVSEAFSSGAIDAREYAKEIEQINEQLEKVNNRRSDAFNYFLGGGISTVLNQKRDQGEALFNEGTNLYQDAFKREASATNSKDWMSALFDKGKAQQMSANGAKMMQGANNAAATVAIIDKIVHGINDAVQGIKGILDDLSESLDYVGGDGDKLKTSRFYGFMNGFSKASQGAANGWDSLKSGNVMGTVQGVLQSFQGWVNGIEQVRDARLDRLIQLSELQVKHLQTISEITERRLSHTLGGVYAYVQSSGSRKMLNDIMGNVKHFSSPSTPNDIAGNKKHFDTRDTAIDIWGNKKTWNTPNDIKHFGSRNTPNDIAGNKANFGSRSMPNDIAGSNKNHSSSARLAAAEALRNGSYYSETFANYKAQYEELLRQRDAEEKRKKTDKSKIADYDREIAKMEDTIDNFAIEMAKQLYNIDVKQWASELTDAVMEAWSKGEDAVQAYHDKAKDLMKDLAKNIIAQRIMEVALKPVEDLIAKTMDANNGKLLESDVSKIGQETMNAGDKAVNNMTAVFDWFKAHGWDFSENGSNSSAGSSIKSITENTADLMASYLNSIRLFCSEIDAAVLMYLPKMSEVSQAQITQLNSIAANTLRNADAAERIEAVVVDMRDNFDKVTRGTKQIYVH